MKTKLQKQKDDASEWLTKHGFKNMIPEAMEKIESDYKRKQKRNHIVFWIIVFTLFSVFWHYASAQETKISAMAGYKSFELGFTYLDEDTELIYGVSASVIDAKFSESIANFHDISKHDFKGDVVPAVHGLVGAKFDRLSFIGKIGGAYINQTINSKQEPKNIYLSYGLMVGYEFENGLYFVGSIDAVNAIMCGVQFKL